MDASKERRALRYRSTDIPRLAASASKLILTTITHGQQIKIEQDDGANKEKEKYYHDLFPFVDDGTDESNRQAERFKLIAFDGHKEVVASHLSPCSNAVVKYLVKVIQMTTDSFTMRGEAFNSVGDVINVSLHIHD
jgi:hypothetical protein